MTDPDFRFFTDFLLLSLVMAAVTCGLLVFGKLAGKKFTARSQYLIWAIVMLRLALPFSLGERALFEINIPTAQSNANDSGVFESHEESETVPTPPETEELVLEEEYVDADAEDNVMETPLVGTWYEIPEFSETAEPFFGMTEPSVTDETLPQVDIAETAEPETAGDFVSPIDQTPVTESEFPWAAVISAAVFTVWLAGALLMIVLTLAQVTSYSRSIKKTLRPADDEISAVYRALLEEYNICRAPKLCVSSAVGSPMLCGYFTPKIILPDIALHENQAAGILSHELTHYKRGDLWLKLISLIGRALHWFNPMVHIAGRAFASAMELSCDERVLCGMSDEARLAYGEVMLDIIKRCNHRDLALTTQFNPRKSAVRERFTNILDSSKKRRGVALVLVAAILCTLAGTLFSCETELDKEQIKLKKVLDVEAGSSIYVSLDNDVNIAGENICVPSEFLGNRRLSKYNFVEAAREHYKDELDVTAYANYDGSITIKSKTDYENTGDYTEIKRIATFDDGVLTVNSTESREVNLWQSVKTGEWTVNNQPIGAYQILHISGPTDERYVYGDPTKALGLNESVLAEMQRFSFTIEYEDDLAAAVSDDGRCMLVTGRAIKASAHDPENYIAAVIDLSDGAVVDTICLDKNDILSTMYDNDEVSRILNEYRSDGYNPVRYKIVRGEPMFAGGVFTIPTVLISDDGEIMIDGCVRYNVAETSSSGFVAYSVNAPANENGISLEMDVTEVPRAEAETLYGEIIADIDKGDIVEGGCIYSLDKDTDNVMIFGWQEAVIEWMNERGESNFETSFVSGGQFSASSRTDLQEDGSYKLVDRLFIRDGDTLYLVREELSWVNRNRTFEINGKDWQFEYRMSEDILYLRHVPRFGEQTTYRFGDFTKPDVNGIVPEQGATDIFLEFDGSDLCALAIDDTQTYAALTYTPADDPTTRHGIVVDLTSAQIIQYVKPWAADSLSPRVVEGGGFKFSAKYRGADGEYTIADYLYDTVTKTLTVPEEQEVYREKADDAFTEIFDNGSAEGYYTPVAIYGDTGIYIKRSYDEVTNSYRTELSTPASDGSYKFTMGRLAANGTEFRDYLTYDIVCMNGEIVSMERDFSAFSKDVIAEEGRVPDEITAGEYFVRVYNNSVGTLVYTRITLDVGSVQIETGVSGIQKLVGDYTYDPDDGTLTLNLGDTVTGEKHTVSGRLFEYDGYVHFICEESTLDEMISPDDPLPLSFPIKGESAERSSYPLFTVDGSGLYEIIAECGDTAAIGIEREYDEESDTCDIILTCTEPSWSTAKTFIAIGIPDGKGSYTDTRAYIVTQKYESIALVENVDVPTADFIRENGIPMTVPLTGEYITQFSGDDGVSALRIGLSDSDNTAVFSVTNERTDGGTSINAVYTFDETKSEITLTEPEERNAVFRIRGKLYLWNGYCAFICEESTVSGIGVTANNAIPYLFEIDTNEISAVKVTNSENWTFHRNSGTDIALVNGDKIYRYQNTDRTAENYINWYFNGEIGAVSSTDETLAVLYYVNDNRPTVTVDTVWHDAGLSEMACAAIDLSDGRIITVVEPTVQEIMDVIDVSGTIAEKFYDYTSIGDHSLILTPKPDLSRDTVTVWFELFAGEQVIKGTCLSVRVMEFSKNMRVHRAITGAEDGMELTLALMELHDKAEDVIYRFESPGSIGRAGQMITYEGHRYFKIADEMFTENGITSMDTFEAYLRSIFTEEMTQSIMAYTSGNSPRMIEYEGELYAVDADRGSRLFLSPPEYFLSEQTDTTATIMCHIYECSDIDADRNRIYADAPEEHEYDFVFEDGVWKCASFPVIR